MIHAAQQPSVDSAYERHLRIVALRRDAERTFLDLGRELDIFVRQKEYKLLGYTSVKAYCGDPDVKLSYSTIRRAIRVKRIFIDKLKVPPEELIDIGMTNLDLLTPHINQENAERLLADAAALSKTDLEQTLPLLPPYVVRYRDWARAWKRAAKKWRALARMNVVLRRERE